MPGFPHGLFSVLLGKPFVVKVVGDYAWEQGVERFGVNEGIDDFQKNAAMVYLLSPHY